MGADTSAVKKKHEWNLMADEEELMENTEIWKAKGGAMDTDTGESTWYQSQPNSPIASRRAFQRIAGAHATEYFEAPGNSKKL